MNLQPSSPQSIPTQPDKTNFVHHFNYTVNSAEDKIDLYRDNYIEIVGISPEIMKFKEKNLLYIKLQSEQKTIHNIHIIKELSSYGLELKLSSQQLDQNAIFCMGIPAHFCKIRKDEIIQTINTKQLELKVMDVYVLPLKQRIKK